MRHGNPLHVDLATVEHVELDLVDRRVDREALRREIDARLFDEAAHRRVVALVVGRELLGDGLHEDHALRHLVDMHDVHHRTSQRAEHGGLGEDHRLRHVGTIARDVGRPAATEGEQHEILRVVAAQVDFALDRRGHVLLDDVADHRGGLVDRDAQRLRDFRVDRGDGLGLVQRHAAGEIGIRRDVAKGDVGVGHGRLGAAEVIAHGPRHRAGAFRADFEPVQQRVEPCDRTAARTHRGRLQHRDADHPAVDDRAELVAAHARVDDHADVEAGAADVACDHVLVPERAADVV